MSLPYCTYRTPMAERNHCSNTRLRGFPLDLVKSRTCERCIWRETEQSRRPVPAWFVLPFLPKAYQLQIVKWQQLFMWGAILKKLFRKVGIKPCTPCGERAKVMDQAGESTRKAIFGK